MSISKKGEGCTCRSEEYQVERIIGSKMVPGTNKPTRQYKVQWKGYDVTEATWEPYQNLQQSKSMLQEYHYEHPQIPNPFKGQEQEFLLTRPPKKRGRPPKNPKESTENKLPLNKPKESGGMVKAPAAPNYNKLPPNRGPQGMSQNMVMSTVAPVVVPESPKEITPSLATVAKESSSYKVTGLFTHPNTNQVFFRVEEGGKTMYKPRKWLLRYCKMDLIDFYRSCIRIKDDGK